MLQTCSNIAWPKILQFIFSLLLSSSMDCGSYFGTKARRKTKLADRQNLHVDRENQCVRIVARVAGDNARVVPAVGRVGQAAGPSRAVVRRRRPGDVGPRQFNDQTEDVNVHLAYLRILLRKCRRQETKVNSGDQSYLCIYGSNLQNANPKNIF